VGGARNPATRSRKAIGDKPGVILDCDAGGNMALDALIPEFNGHAA
jgi:hypothetical protein